MKKLLFVNACVRGELSRTLILAKEYLKQKNKNNEYEVIEIDLGKSDLKYLKEEDFVNDTQSTPLKVKYANQFASVDEILIAAPFWEFTFPAVLSCYFEIVSEVDVTFKYSNKGSVGLCRAKSLTYIYTSGDNISELDDVGTKLLKRLCDLYGIKKFNSYYAKGLDIFGNDVQSLIDKEVKRIKNELE